MLGGGKSKLILVNSVWLSTNRYLYIYVLKSFTKNSIKAFQCIKICLDKYITFKQKLNIIVSTHVLDWRNEGPTTPLQTDNCF